MIEQPPIIPAETYASYRAAMDKANEWIGDKLSYRTDEAPAFVRNVTNEIRGEVEIFELYRDKPDEFVAYTAANGRLTTWPGTVIGEFTTRRTWRDRWGNRRRSIDATLPGLGRYRGQTAAENGWYLVLRRC